jgi:hypothetical protein
MLTSKLEAVVIPIWNCRGLFLSEGRIKKGLIIKAVNLATSRSSWKEDF